MDLGGISKQIGTGFFPHYSTGIKVLIGLTGMLLLASMVIYGASVYFERQVIQLGKQTRSLQEDNQDLQISLDRLRSYQKVAESSSKFQGLQAAEEIIDVASKNIRQINLPLAPRRVPPKEAYGY